MSIKNPFGLRNGIIISVDDLAEDERGLSCDCVCPNCGDKFQARMGNIRVHHFAHDGEGCNEEIAFLKGLYMLMQRYMEEHEITLPPLDITWTYSEDKYTERNFWDRIYFGSINYGYTIRVNEAKSIKFDNSEILYDGERPVALKLTYHSSDLYITIQPPATFCKQSKARSFAPHSYLVLNVSKESFENRTSEEYFSIFTNAMKLWDWGFNSKAIKALDEINKQNEHLQEKNRWQREELERKRKERLEKEKEQLELLQKKREKWARAAAERQEQMKQQLRERAVEHIYVNIEPESPPQPSREARLKEGYNEVLNRFSENNQSDIIRDSYGQRWVQCEICREIKPDYDFGSYGGKDHVNLGVCRECGKK